MSCVLTKYLVWLPVLLSFLSLVSGCSPKKEGRAEYAAKIQSLYEAYLDSDINGARQNAEAILRMRLSPGSGKDIQAGLWDSYARLYTIEFTSGDKFRAKILYEKSKYWYLFFLEAVELSPEEIVKGIEKFTPEECMRKTLESDRRATNGRGPRYLAQSPISK